MVVWEAYRRSKDKAVEDNREKTYSSRDLWAPYLFQSSALWDAGQVIAEAEIVALDAKAKHNRHIAGPPLIRSIPPHVGKDSTP